MPRKDDFLFGNLDVKVGLECLFPEGKEQSISSFI